MQYSQSIIISIASLMASVSAENLLVALNSDIQQNVNQYLSFVQANTQANVAPLLSLYQAAQTYTDESYTTLVDSAELSSISAFATQLPWFSSRIEPELDAAATTTTSTTQDSTSSSSADPETSSAVAMETSSVASESVTSSSSSSESSSSTEITSSKITSVTHSASPSKTTTGSASGTSSTSETSVSTAGADYLAPGAGVAALALGVIALL